jgi:hypothetical protein
MALHAEDVQDCKRQLSQPGFACFGFPKGRFWILIATSLRFLVPMNATFRPIDQGCYLSKTLLATTYQVGDNQPARCSDF